MRNQVKREESPDSKASPGISLRELAIGAWSIHSKEKSDQNGNNNGTDNRDNTKTGTSPDASQPNAADSSSVSVPEDELLCEDCGINKRQAATTFCGTKCVQCRDKQIVQQVQSTNATKGKPTKCLNCKRRPTRGARLCSTHLKKLSPNALILENRHAATSWTCTKCLVRSTVAGYTICGPCKDANREYNQGRVQGAQEKGLCYMCKKRPHRADVKTCDRCHEKKLTRQRRRRAAVAEEGKCGSCFSRPAAPGVKYCGVCRLKHQERNRTYRAALAKNGICYYCGTRPTQPGFRKCGVCRRGEARQPHRRLEGPAETASPSPAAAAAAETSSRGEPGPEDGSEPEDAGELEDAGEEQFDVPDVLMSEPEDASRGCIAVTNLLNPRGESLEQGLQAVQERMAIANLLNSDDSEPAEQVSQGRIAITNLLNPRGYEVEAVVVDGRKVELVVLD